MRRIYCKGDTLLILKMQSHVTEKQLSSRSWEWMEYDGWQGIRGLSPTNSRTWFLTWHHEYGGGNKLRMERQSSLHLDVSLEYLEKIMKWYNVQTSNPSDSKIINGCLSCENCSFLNADIGNQQKQDRGICSNKYQIINRSKLNKMKFVSEKKRSLLEQNKDP